ncbi:GNAT family N-acetyltransferase [Halostella litorea]|uniref:GNAT family N-acetyltransferase n=1 Tax=Halostella litorea TaxID=2528831 RepID=UPI0010926B91|nr:GNAT family protein [Halostella litorea]
MPGPIVREGDRLVLRTVERDDAAFVQRGSTDPRIRFPFGAMYPGSRAEQEAGMEGWLETDGVAAYLACVDDPDAPAGRPDDEAADATTPVGMVSARGLDGDRPWLAYWLLPEHQGEGYGTEMVRLAVDDVFASHPVHGISAGVYDYNEASRGLLESLGFRQESRRRQSRYVDGAYRDELQYGLLRREWEGD